MTLPILNASNLRIEGTPIKCPSALGFERYKIEKGGRVASGLMHIDIIAKKKKFTLKYDVISGHDLKVILDLLDTMSAYFKFQWVELDEDNECTVYPGAIKYSRFRMHGGVYYKDVTFDLIER